MTDLSQSEVGSEALDSEDKLGQVFEWHESCFPHFAEGFERHLLIGVVDAGGEVEQVENLLWQSAELKLDGAQRGAVGGGELVASDASALGAGELVGSVSFNTAVVAGPLALPVYFVIASTRRESPISRWGGYRVMVTGLLLWGVVRNLPGLEALLESG